MSYFLEDKGYPSSTVRILINSPSPLLRMEGLINLCESITLMLVKFWKFWEMIKNNVKDIVMEMEKIIKTK